MFFVSRSGYYGSYNAATVASIMFIVGIVLALICTILSVILITPEKRRAALPKFFKFLHDLFNVRWLLIEKIFKFFYIFLRFLRLSSDFYFCLPSALTVFWDYC